jgi:diacylglycerol O-acyltransferase
MTAIGHFSILSETKWNPSIITLLVSLKCPNAKQPFGSTEFAQLWRDKGMSERHPRLQARVATDGYFVPKEDAPNLPVTEGLAPLPGQERQDLQRRIAHLQMTPLDLSQGLWKAWLIPWMRSGATKSTTEKEGRSVVLLQSHHAMADGVSLGAALLDLTDEADALRESIRAAVQKRRGKARSCFQKVLRRLRLLGWFLVGSMLAMWHQCGLWWSSWWETNPWHTLRQRLPATAEPARTISYSPAGMVAQAKWVAQVLGDTGVSSSSKITVNDVFVAAVTGAVARQLAAHRQRDDARQAVNVFPDDTASKKRSPLAHQAEITIAIPVHLGGGVLLPGTSIGNRIGAFCARVPGETPASPAARLTKVHAALQAVKQTPAPFLGHYVAKLATLCLPTSWASAVYRRANAGATCVVTNVRGPPAAVHWQGRELESIYGFVPLPPGIPIGVSVNSYNGKMSLSLTAEPWAVPDGDQFLVWVLEEYMALVQAAKEKSVLA